MHTDPALAHYSTKVIKPVQLSTVLLQGYGRIIDLDIKWIYAWKWWILALRKYIHSENSSL